MPSTSDVLAHRARSTRRALARVVTPALAAALSLSATAVAAEDLRAAITGGKVNADLRLRYESVDQDNALDQADALTLRTLLGYTTQTWHGLSAFVEMENINALVDDYSQRPPPVEFSVVADPEGAETNQWGLRYTGIANLVLTAGRSKQILDNARWVGNVGWRQNEQTYDGYFLKYTPTTSLAFHYSYLTNVNNIFFANLDLEGHLINASWEMGPALKLTAYSYLLDFELFTAPTPDVDTIGLRASGALPLGADLKLLYTAEFASQEAEVPTGDFDTDYLSGELGLGYKAVTFKLGYESLGSDDGAFALMTPLATLHAFNGWNDVFLVTPAAGLIDSYASLGAKLGKVSLLAAYHEFESDEGSVDYGSEVNLQATMPLAEKFTAGIKYGAYSADDFAVDTDKLWIWTQFSF